MRNYNVLIEQEDKFFVATNLDLWVVSQWYNTEEALENLKEATELFLEGNKKITNLNSFKKVFLSTITV